MWQGSTTLLDRSQLGKKDLNLLFFFISSIVLIHTIGAFDVDTLPQSIEYSFGKADCGFLATGPNLSDPISTFNQQQIEKHQIAFVHQGWKT